MNSRNTTRHKKRPRPRRSRTTITAASGSAAQGARPPPDWQAKFSNRLDYIYSVRVKIPLRQSRGSIYLEISLDDTRCSDLRSFDVRRFQAVLLSKLCPTRELWHTKNCFLTPNEGAARRQKWGEDADEVREESLQSFMDRRQW